VLNPWNKETRDSLSFPFGCLTAKGLDHMRSIGAVMAARFPLLLGSSDVEVFSTNYHRTQISTQALLSGMGIDLEGNQTRQIPVIVREMSKCSMSVYDGRKDLASALIKQVQQQESFRRLEEEVRQTREKLLASLPLLRRDDNSIDWMAAFDHFVCRSAHNVSVDESKILFCQNIVPDRNYNPFILLSAQT